MLNSLYLTLASFFIILKSHGAVVYWEINTNYVFNLLVSLTFLNELERYILFCYFVSSFNSRVLSGISKKVVRFLVWQKHMYNFTSLPRTCSSASLYYLGWTKRQGSETEGLANAWSQAGPDSLELISVLWPPPPSQPHSTRLNFHP